MAAIWDFDQIDDLLVFLENASSQAIALLALQEDNTDIQNLLRSLELENIYVVEEWANDNAEEGQTPLEVVLFYGTDLSNNPSDIPEFRQIMGVESPEDGDITNVPNQITQLINQGEVSPPEQVRQTFNGVRVNAAGEDRLPENLSNILGRREGNKVANIRDRIAVEFVEPEETREGVADIPVQFQNLPRIPFDQLRDIQDDDDDDEEEDQDQEAEVEEQQEEQLESEEPALPEDPPEGLPEDILGDDNVGDEGDGDKDEDELPDPLTEREKIEERINEFEFSEDKLSIPAGNPERKIAKRKPFDFELRMGLESNVLGMLDGFGPGDQITNAVGWSIELNDFGIDDPPSIFPRTGIYVREYLSSEGPAYILEIYRNLVFYAGFISALHDRTFRPGTYDSMREFMWRLNEVPERGGPNLVDRLSQQEAASQGLESIPDHPTIEGEKAPWLENRTYYDIDSDNEGSDIWKNVTEFLYGEPQAENQ